MNRITLAAALLGTAAVAFLAGATTQGKQDKKEGAVFVSSDDAKYKELAPGATMATISGDPDKGAFRGFTKFAPGANFTLHTHSSELHMVVIKGAYIYRPENGPEKRVTAGCYLDIPAGDRHSSGGDTKDGALFYTESSGRFDLTFVEPKK